MGQTADLTTAGTARWGDGINTRERNFWIALLCAVAFHGAFFVSFVRGNPSRLGDEKGADDAISVSLVTAEDFKSRSTIEQEAPPAPPPKPAQPEAQKPPPPPKEEAKQQPPEPPQPPQAEQPPEELKQPDPSPPEQEVAKQEDPKLEDTAPDLLSLPTENPANMKSETKPKAAPNTNKASASKPPAKKQPSPQKQMANLDLAPPPSMQQPSFSGGRGAGLQRPPGITRSGVNDAFARAVIRALQQTMPQLEGALGQVTVRILLSENGNVVEVRLLAGAKDPSISQNVVFAARQTSYPIPPAGSNLADRTFMVTYIYD